MSFVFEERQSDSPLVEKMWRTQSSAAGRFTSVAACNWEIVITTQHGRSSFTVRGPETRATTADIPPDAEFFGITFRLGAFMPHFPAIELMDRNDITLPGATGNAFWLAGGTWELPTFDNADTFIERLVRQDLLGHDHLVEDVLQRHAPDLSTRTVRRRFLRATGLTPGAIHQIERARYAIRLLQAGMPILDTVFEAGFYDQPHMTRALKHFSGHTPAQIADVDRPPLMSPTEPMSLLYNTQPDYGVMMSHVQPVTEGVYS